jgi:predicted protein tyrosine phosphatase
MPFLKVTSLSRLHETTKRVDASHVVTLINVATRVERPPGIAPANHLFLGMSDITAQQDGHVLPGRLHVTQLLAFARGWDRAKPMVIHCWAGISRSTGAAFITACALNPERDEAEIAATLRASAPSATPNAKLVAVADEILGRNGRMSAAIEAIGRGEDAFEGTPFRLNLH